MNTKGRFATITAFLFAVLAMGPVFAASASTSSSVTACNALTTVYVGHSVKCDSFKVSLTDLGQPNNGIAAASVNISYKKAAIETTQITPGTLLTLTPSLSGASKYLTVYVNRTFAGLYEYQKWAEIDVFTSKYETPLQAVYVGHNATCGNKITVELTGLGQSNQPGQSPVLVNVYRKGVLTNTTTIQPKTLEEFNAYGDVVDVYVNQTFAGLYAYQKWAQIQVFC